MYELACPTACTYLFKVRPGVLSKNLSHMWDKLNLPMFLKLVGILWNRTLVEVVDKLSSTSVDFIRSERELENMHLYGV